MVPIGWSGSWRCVSSSSTFMSHAWAKLIAWFRFVMGSVQCLWSLSHRASGNDVFRASISSLLYGVLRTSLLPCSFSVLVIGLLGRFRLRIVGCVVPCRRSRCCGLRILLLLLRSFGLVR